MDAFDALDLNKDGVISREEFLQVQEGGREGIIVDISGSISIYIIDIYIYVLFGGGRPCV